MAARRSKRKPTKGDKHTGSGSANPPDPIEPDHLNRDPYFQHPRNLVVQVTDQTGIRNAYLAFVDMDPRAFLVNQDPHLDAILPSTTEAELLFRPDPPVPAGIPDELFSFVGFPVANLAEAMAALARVKAYIGETNLVLTSAYVQGLFGSPSSPVHPWNERDIGLQDYLQPARYGGIDAMHAWTWGAKGQGETLYVMEAGCWDGHPDFFDPGGNSSISVFPGPPPAPDLLHARQHGTGTLGIVLATENTGLVRKGIVGIAPMAKAEVAVVCPGLWKYSQPFSNMVVKVLIQGYLNKIQGSIVLLSMCYMPPVTNVWLPIETDPWMNSVIKWLLNSSAVVIEPAGNSDLDLNDVWQPPYPHTLGPPPAMTGAIVVGASRSKAPFAKTLLSNFAGSVTVNLGSGSVSVPSGRVSLFSWGENVYTTSVDLKPGSLDPPNPTTDFVPAYTHMSGTSSASAIIAGAALCVQSKSAKRLNNAEMLSELSAGATPSQPGSGIGVQPNLKKIIKPPLWFFS